MNIPHKVSMDLVNPAPTSPRIEVVQDDRYARNLELILSANGIPWQVPTGAYAVVTYRKEDGKGGKYDKLPDGASAWSVQGNILTVTLAPQVLTVPGNVELEVALISGSKTARTFKIEMNVRKKLESILEDSEDYINLMNIGKVTTLSPGQAATATLRGNGEGMVLDLGIPQGRNGKDGYIPVKGIDYWTKEEQEAIQAQANAYIADELAQRTQLTPEFANTVAECTDTAKLYVLPDGFIYAYLYTPITKQVTIETKENGYWNFYNNKMNWNDAEGYLAWRTNMIDVEEGDSFSYTGNSDKYCPSVLWFDSSETVFSTQYGSTVYTAPSGAAFAQFYSYGGSDDEELKVVHLSEEFDYNWHNSGRAFVPADYEDRIVNLEDTVADLNEAAGNTSVYDVLGGKKIVYDGDSICIGGDGSKGYAKIIAEMVGGSYVNQAVGGGRLVTLLDGYDYHSIVDNLPNLPTDGDLYCFDGGVNDYWTDEVRLGTFDYTNFDGELDTTTVCGALETIFRYCLNTFVGKPVCFIIAHKCQGIAYAKNTEGKTFKEYRDAMVGICEKYSIPYYDAFSESGLNGWNEAQNNAFLTANSQGTPDGCHPNVEGYKRYYVPQLLSLFRKILPDTLS